MKEPFWKSRPGAVGGTGARRTTVLRFMILVGCLTGNLALDVAAARAQSPARASRTPPVAVPAPPPAPQQLAASIAGLRKELRRHAGELRTLKGQQAQTGKRLTALAGTVTEQGRRIHALERLLAPLLGVMILLGILALVLLAAAVASARRLAELEAAYAAAPTAPSVVQQGIRAIEERLQHLEAEEETPQRHTGSSVAEANGEGAPAPQRE